VLKIVVLKNRPLQGCNLVINMFEKKCIQFNLYWNWRNSFARKNSFAAIGKWLNGYYWFKIVDAISLPVFILQGKFLMFLKSAEHAEFKSCLCFRKF